MASRDLTPPPEFERAFRKGRRRHAAFAALAPLVYIALAVLLGADRGALIAGVVLTVGVSLTAYIGGAAARALGPALLLGAGPFIVTHLAQSAGHVCHGGACTHWCMPACSITGLVVGGLFALRASRDAQPVPFFTTGAIVMTLVGTMGCRCVGYGSTLGLLAGLVIASVPAWPRWAKAA